MSASFSAVQPSATVVLETREAHDEFPGLEIKLLPPRDPESRGMAERINKSFRQPFISGRDIRSTVDFNG